MKFWSRVGGMFLDQDETLDEIVLIVTAAAVLAFGMELYTCLWTKIPLLVGTQVFWVHPTFSLAEFGEGFMKLGAGAGVWLGLRTAARSYGATKTFTTTGQ